MCVNGEFCVDFETFFCSLMSGSSSYNATANGPIVDTC